MDDLKTHWSENGYLVLKGFFNNAELNDFSADVENLLEDRSSRAGEITIDVLDGIHLGKRMKLRNAPDEALSSTYKLNDLYLDSEACRHLSLAPKLVAVLSELLDGEPMIINSLNFKKGSQQPLHFDTYYMPPPVENMMVVSSICLEDQAHEAGPVTYYPASHKIPPYVFSHGRLHAIDNEMTQATAYIERELESRGLRKEVFVGQAGDVFIWHAQLYHGGTPILDPKKTRKSLVTHYWRAGDMPEANVGSVEGAGKYWIRDHSAAP
jgi:ectoine hydroxylase-related dioxygenase (phytanoyl-CoA dioxygenase family)